jgi:type IV pilus assembly protein PilA
MKNKKGFTLIELLAVIVILAIIALIAVPIILNMINSARKSAARSSALGYIDAIEYNNGFAQVEPDNYTLITGTDIKTSTINIKLKGKKPTKGTITINTSGKVSSGRMVFNGYWVEYDGKDAKVTGKYTPGKVTITFKDGDTVLETRQVNEGSTIGSFPNITLGENQILNGWYSDSSYTNEVGTSTQVDDDITCYVKISGPRTCEQFATDSWETIQKAVQDDNISVYNIGDTKEVTINGTDYTVRLSNKTTGEHCGDDDTAYSQTACGFVVEFVDIITSMQMRDEFTNVGGYPATLVYDYLKNTLYGQLPADLQSAIKPTRVISGYGSNGTDSANFTTTDTLYLLSGIEVYGQDAGGNNLYDTAAGTTHQLEYYSNNGVTYSTSSWNGTNLDKTIKQYNGSNKWCWLRPANSNDSYFFAGVGSNGSWSGDNARGTNGVAPAFRIG